MGGCTTNLPPLARLLLLVVAAAILRPRACGAKSILHDVDAKRVLKANNTVGCPTPNGTVLLPGEDLMVVGDRSCTIMQCTEQGLDTLEAECWAPRCVQPQRKPGACCLSCPDGDSCRLPSGEVIRADTEYRHSRMICSCPLIKKGLGWDEDLVNAVCRLVTTTAPPPTTRPPTCALPDGDSLGVGLTRVVPVGKNGCRKYECDGRHHLTVSYWECRTLNCVNPVRRPGACCMTCPNDTDSSSGPESYVTSPAPKRNVTSTPRVLYVDVITFLKLLFGFPVQIGHGNRTVEGQQGDHWNRHGSLGTQDKSNGTQGTHRGNQRENHGNRWGSHGNQLGSHGNQRRSRGNRWGSHGNRRGGHGNRRGSHGNRRGNQSGSQENQRGSHKNRWGSQVGNRGNGSGSQSGSEESGKRKTWRWQWFSHGKKKGCTRKGNGRGGYRLPSESPFPDPKAASESLSAEPEVEPESPPAPEPEVESVSLPAPEPEVESVSPPAPEPEVKSVSPPAPEPEVESVSPPSLEPEVEPVSLPSLESEMYSSLQLSQDSAGSQEVTEQQLLQQKRRQARRLRKQDRQQRKKECKQHRKGQMTQKQLEERRPRKEKRKKRQEERRRLQKERKKKQLEDRQQRKEERTRKQEERTRLQEERKKKQLEKRQQKKEERKRKQDERTRRQEQRQRRRKQKKVEKRQRRKEEMKRKQEEMITLY